MRAEQLETVMSDGTRRCTEVMRDLDLWGMLYFCMENYLRLLLFDPCGIYGKTEQVENGMKWIKIHFL